MTRLEMENNANQKRIAEGIEKLNENIGVLIQVIENLEMQIRNS